MITAVVSFATATTLDACYYNGLSIPGEKAITTISCNWTNFSV